MCLLPRDLPSLFFFFLIMTCEVKLFVAGKVFTETVQARDYQEAKQVALARNPNATVVGVTAVF